MTDSDDSVFCYAMSDEVGLDCFGALPSQGIVYLVGTDGIGVPVHFDAQPGEVTEDGNGLVQDWN